jgi:hypothetical protein
MEKSTYEKHKDAVYDAASNVKEAYDQGGVKDAYSEATNQYQEKKEECPYLSGDKKQ